MERKARVRGILFFSFFFQLLKIHTRVDGKEEVAREDIILFQISDKFSGFDIEMLASDGVLRGVLAEDNGLVAGSDHYWSFFGWMWKNGGEG